MRWHLALAASLLLLAAGGRARALELGENQVLIEAMLLSLSTQDDLRLGVEFLEPGERIDLATEAQLDAAAALAAGQTQSVMTGIAADAPLAASAVGRAARDHLELARLEQIHLHNVLARDGQPKAKELLTPIIVAQNFQFAALTALQGRPERFPNAKRVPREAGEYGSAYSDMLPFLQLHGLPADFSALFEPFSGGKRKTLLERIGFVPGLDTRARVRSGQLEISARSKEPVTTGSDFAFQLPDDFTVLLSVSLPDNGKGKPRPELEGFSVGVKLTSDASSDPAKVFFIEHQTIPEGWIQSFISTKSAILQVSPHATASHARQITSFFVKDGDTLVIGGLLRDGPNETLIQHSVSAVGDLPVLGLYFRNGTKKTVFQADNLFIYVTPHLVSDP